MLPLCYRHPDVIPGIKQAASLIFSDEITWKELAKAAKLLGVKGFLHWEGLLCSLLPGFYIPQEREMNPSPSEDHPLVPGLCSYGSATSQYLNQLYPKTSQGCQDTEHLMPSIFQPFINFFWWGTKHL